MGFRTVVRKIARKFANIIICEKSKHSDAEPTRPVRQFKSDILPLEEELKSFEYIHTIRVPKASKSKSEPEKLAKGLKYHTVDEYLATLHRNQILYLGEQD